MFSRFLLLLSTPILIVFLCTNTVWSLKTQPVFLAEATGKSEPAEPDLLTECDYDEQA